MHFISIYIIKKLLLYQLILYLHFEPHVAFLYIFFFFFFNDTATTEISTPLYTLSLHDALPISAFAMMTRAFSLDGFRAGLDYGFRSEEHTSELQSHSGISYAVFCLKKKKT